MNLNEFSSQETIFIDANIFIYHLDSSSPYQPACSSFLQRIEHQEITAIISAMVVDEVIYNSIILKGSQMMPGKSLASIRKRLTRDHKFSSSCYAFGQQIIDYLDILRLGNFSIAETTFDITKQSCLLGQRYSLLPRDALHLATCYTFSIRHIATRDPHFENLPQITVWSP